ncbi:MAG TPA: hypothetical protein VMX17_05615 [Candidatus Glassbacteria bacterium]|nr:hypothetical protein [Candidatus Glassbacteria bacterium]
MSVPFMFVDGNLTVVLKNKSHQVLPDHLNYKMIMEALPTASEDELLGMVDVETAVASFSDGRVTVENGVVKFDGDEVHGSISKRILEFMKNGLPFEPLVQFLHNVMENPSMQSQRELYDFLEHENLPITEDGYFLAYKAVRSDFKDKYRGVFDNSVGQVCEMVRAKVDDNREAGCSQGLHAGALSYVASYGSVDSGDKIVIVKINPKDVVSVPKDCDCQKLRTCRYEVVGLYEGELDRPMYSADYSNSPIYNDDYDPDYDDEDEDEEYYDEEYWDQFDEDDEDN